MTLSQAALRSSREGQVIQEDTTVSSGWHWTAIGNEVSLPSGASAPQQSTTRVAPYALKICPMVWECATKSARRAQGTEATNPST